MSSSPVTQISGAVLLLGVLGAIVALALHGTVTGSDAMVAITAIVAGVTAGAKAAAPPADTSKP